MQLLGMSIGKKAAEDSGQAEKSKVDLKSQLKQLLDLASRYETSIIALLIAGLLTVTALRMLRYTDPPIDDTKVQAALSKNTKTRIDPKVVQKIGQLQDSGTTTTPQVESGRTNPFSEQ